MCPSKIYQKLSKIPLPSYSNGPCHILEYTGRWTDILTEKMVSTCLDHDFQSRSKGVLRASSYSFSWFSSPCSCFNLEFLCCQSVKMIQKDPECLLVYNCSIHLSIYVSICLSMIINVCLTCHPAFQFLPHEQHGLQRFRRSSVPRWPFRCCKPLLADPIFALTSTCQWPANGRQLHRNSKNCILRFG